MITTRFHDQWAANCQVLGGVDEADPDRVCGICDGSVLLDAGEVPF